MGNAECEECGEKVVDVMISEFEDLKFEDLRIQLLLNQFNVKIIYNCTQLQHPFRACPPWRRVGGREEVLMC